MASANWPARWFAQDPTPRVVVGRDLTLLAANRRAEQLIGANGALALRDGALSARDRRTSQDLSAAITAAGREPCFKLVGADGGGPSLLVEIVVLDGEGIEAVGMTLRDLTAAVEIECADLEPIFGVTPGEHQVIVQLLRGQSSRDIADRFGKSILTIRTHVKRAYGKIGVKTRGQLFARLLPYLSIR
jgi:DNA-binding CsgD family transcriptional regulator